MSNSLSEIFSKLDFQEWCKYLSSFGLGRIQKSKSIIMNGKKGFLVWGFVILHHELSFLSDDGEVIQSLFISSSRKQMEKKFNSYFED